MSAGGRTWRITRNRGGLRRGAMLLEVLMALAILTLGMATVGIQINSGLGLEREAAEVTRRATVIESMLAQVEALVAQAMAGTEEEESGPVMPDREMEIEGRFGLVFPGFAYRLVIEPTEIEELNRVTIELLQAEFDPDTGDLLDEPEPVYWARTLRATPPRINLQFVGGRGVPASLTPFVDEDGYFNPWDLVSMDPAKLLELLPMLMAEFGSGDLARMMGGMSPEQLMEALGQQQAALGDQEGDAEGDFDLSQSGPTPQFEEINNPELPQDQFEWMLEQLRKKQGG